LIEEGDELSWLMIFGDIFLHFIDNFIIDVKGSCDLSPVESLDEEKNAGEFQGIVKLRFVF